MTTEIRLVHLLTLLGGALAAQSSSATQCVNQFVCWREFSSGVGATQGQARTYCERHTSDQAQMFAMQACGGLGVVEGPWPISVPAHTGMKCNFIEAGRLPGKCVQWEATCHADYAAWCNLPTRDDEGDDDIPGPQGDGDCDPRRENCTPIVIDLSGDGFEFTDRAGGVAFDLDADGTLDRVSWTSPDGNDAFLVLDRNENGDVDDGKELFGGVTPQPPGAEPNGYRALAQLDTDRDGAITSTDEAFARLQLWIDASHDGIAQGGELLSLSAAGILSVSLDYRESKRFDQYGNLLRYHARVDLRGHLDPVGSVDVFFLAD